MATTPTAYEIFSGRRNSSGGGAAILYSKHLRTLNSKVESPALLH